MTGTGWVGTIVQIIPEICFPNARHTGSLLVPPNAGGLRKYGRLCGSSGLTDIPP